MTPEQPSAPLAPPTTSKLWELTGIREVPRLAANSWRLKQLPRGSANVIAFPGYSTNDAATQPLRSLLNSLGHTAVGWGFGVNMAQVEAMLSTATAMVENRVNRAGKPATLIGWSNGGVYAREIARDRPDLVSQVITYGTPIVGGPKFTRGAKFYQAEEIDRIERVVTHRNTKAIECPITAFYSRRDHIVDWRACIDTFSPNVENIEVRSTHVSMGIDPDVLAEIARRLA